MEPLSNMAAMSSPCVCTVQDDESVGQSSGAQLARGQMLQRRRHSFFLPRRKSIVGHIMETEEGLLLKVGRQLQQSAVVHELFADFRASS